MGQGAKADAPYFHGLLGKLVAESGDIAAGLALVDDGLRFAHETGEHWTDPELYRIRGEVLSAAEPPGLAAAEDAFETAVAVARRQESRTFGLRAALALAKLRNASHRCARGGRRAHARGARLLADAGDAGNRRGPGAARDARGAPAHELSQEQLASRVSRANLTQLEPRSLLAACRGSVLGDPAYRKGGRHAERGSPFCPSRPVAARRGLGANDGIISTASLIVGVAAAAGQRDEILTAAFAGLTAGAMSMAAGDMSPSAPRPIPRRRISNARSARFASTRARNCASSVRSTSIGASQLLWRLRLPNS